MSRRGKMRPKGKMIRTQQSSLFTLLILSLAMLTATFSFSSDQARAQEQSAENSTQQTPNVALIYDLSKSMWAKLDNTIKLTIAKDAIAATLQNYDKKINFGMVSFGHVENKGCNNSEIISNFKKLDAAATIKAMEPLRPRGDAPIGKALLDASSLPLTNDNAAKQGPPLNIILLTDGKSNCPIDPCETASSLKGANPNIVIDVIGLGEPGDPDIAPLSCVIKPSNGRLVYAKNKTEVANAITSSIERAKVRDPAQIAAKAENENSWAGATEIVVEPVQKNATGAVEEPENAKPKDVFKENNLTISKTDGGLSLVALLNDNSPEINEGIVWRIYNEKPNKLTGKHKLISAHRTASPVMSLPAGNYLINAAYGRAFLTRTIKIEAGKNKTERFILNAGGLRISSVLANGSPVPDNTVLFDILSDERDQFGKRLKVLGNVRPGVVVRLNAAIYHIVSTYGDANAKSQADVSIVAGKLTEATINHQAAKVTFKLVYQKGGEALADTKWSLLTPRGEIVKKSVGALPTHFLAAGDYTILAERGKEKYSQHFTVNAGDTSQVEVIIQ